MSDLKSTEIQPWVHELFEKRSEEFGKAHPGYRCMPDIGPFASFGIFKILQAPGTTAFLPEGSPRERVQRK